MSLNLGLGFSEFNLRMGKSIAHKVYEFEDFRLDGEHLMLYRSGEPIPIAPKAAETLLVLIEHRGEILSKDDLLEAVWPDTIVEESNLFLYLSVLRKTLGTQKNGEPWFETLRRRGYQFCGEVNVIHKRAEGAASWADNDSQVGSNNRTQSGQLYLLKDWKEAGSESPPLTRAQSSLSATKAVETGDGTGYRQDTSLGSPSVEKEAVQPLVRVEPNFDNPKKSVFWPAVAMVIIIASAAALFIYRSSSRQNEVNAQISITTLTNGVDVQGAAISRDGKNFVYDTVEEESNHLYLQQVGQLNSIEILATKAWIGAKTFSPDGFYVYYLSKDTSESHMSLFRIPAHGGAPNKVLGGIYWKSSISFSPDGSEFVFSRYDDEKKVASIMIARRDGSGEREVMSSNAECLNFPAWSPDGKTIAFARERPFEKKKDQYDSIEVVNVNGGQPRNLLNEKFGNCFKIAWTSNGDGIVFGGTRLGEHMTARRDQVWFASLNTGKLLRISPEGTRYVFEGLTDDNAAIMFPLNRPSQIWVMDADGDSRSARQLTLGNTDGRTGIAPLPDGRVGYMLRNGDRWEIWVMNGDGSRQKQIFNSIPISEELRATPDGKYFVFNGEVDGNSQLFRINSDGSDLRQLTFGDEIYVSDSSPSSDSRSIVFTRVANLEGRRSVSLYSVPIEGGEPRAVEGATVGAFTPHHSPDGKFISYIDASSVPSRLAVLATDDATVRYYDAGGSTVLNIGAVWTPDNKAIAYIRSSEKVANVWVQPIEGGPPRQLTDFDSGRIYRVAYSADGKRLYLARGYAVNDALLVKGFVN